MSEKKEVKQKTRTVYQKVFTPESYFPLRVKYDDMEQEVIVNTASEIRPGVDFQVTGTRMKDWHG